MRNIKMSVTTDDLRIQETQELISPEELIDDLPVSDTVSDTCQYRSSLDPPNSHS
jgi:3-deoxy-D-arabino-heptulosonate 7-phosphate (DAHP) synthase